MQIFHHFETSRHTRKLLEINISFQLPYKSEQQSFPEESTRLGEWAALIKWWWELALLGIVAHRRQSLALLLPCKFQDGCWSTLYSPLVTITSAGGELVQFKAHFSRPWSPRQTNYIVLGESQKWIGHENTCLRMAENNLVECLENTQVFIWKPALKSLVVVCSLLFVPKKAQ